MQIRLKAGVRSIKLDSVERRSLVRAKDVVSDLVLYDPSTEALLVNLNTVVAAIDEETGEYTRVAEEPK